MQDLLESGQFDSPEQFITYALASVKAEYAETIAWFKAQVEQGLQSLDEGHCSTKSTGNLAAEVERELAKRR